LIIKPVYQYKKAPCFSRDSGGQNGCPAWNDIPAFLYSISQGSFEQAFQIIKKTNPFSGGCGRFCDHPCESACNRAKFDSPVNIRDLERFISDYGYTNNLLPDKIDNFAGKSVAIIGAGPAGLSSAYFLKLSGFKVDVLEKENIAGGMMALGIPLFRYPREILEWELNYIKSLGINIDTNIQVDSKKFKELCKTYDYVLIATGAHKSRKLGIPGETLKEVIIGIDFLKQFNLHQKFRNSKNFEDVHKEYQGKKLIVVGGGYTAIDVARTARRCNMKVSVYYRRGESDMNIHPGDTIECKKEGIEFHFFLSPAQIDKQNDGSLLIKMEQMKTGEMEADGKYSIIPTEIFSDVETDFLVKAIGETPELGFLKEFEIKKNNVILKAKHSGSADIFIAGDARFGYASDVGKVVRAIASGRKSSDEIIQHASGKAKVWYSEETIAQYNSIKTKNFHKQARARVSHLKPELRTSNFHELSASLESDEAIYAASRCFNCGICIQCDMCYHYSQGSIAKIDTPWSDDRKKRYFTFIEDKICNNTLEAVHACPRNAMNITNLDEISKNDFLKSQYTTLQNYTSAHVSLTREKRKNLSKERFKNV